MMVNLYEETSPDIMKKRRFLTPVVALLGATALSGCWLSSDDDNKQITTSTANFRALPIQGTWEDNNAHAVYSTADGEGPNNTRFTVQFTANEEIVIQDNDLSKTYTFTADQVQGPAFHEMDFMRIFVTQVDNRADMADPDNYWADPAFEEVSILTPSRANGPEYALARIGSVDGQQWLLVGDPTSAVLNGTANFSGGYYSNAGHSAVDMAADFGGNADAIDFTIHRPDADVGNAVYGVASISFSADFDGATNTLSGVSKPINEVGALHDRAHVEGAFFNNGNASAGLIRLEDTSTVTADHYGGYHVVRD